jgi:hypothetical protein
MAQCTAALALTLVCKSEVVVRVGVVRNERYGFLVGLGGIVEALHLIEDVAEVEECEGVLGIRDGSATIEVFS